MTDFTDPKRQLQSQLDDLRDDIDEREKELREINIQLEDLNNKKELLEDELEEFYISEKKMQQEARRPE